MLIAGDFIIFLRRSERKPIGLTDYKFYCFNGEPQYLYISEGLEDHSTAHISFLTLDWKFAPFGRTDYQPFRVLPPRPNHLNQMVEIARILSKEHPFLRVDLYEINNHVYFSELTFSPVSGFMPFKPDIWDEKLGNLLELPSERY